MSLPVFNTRKLCCCKDDRAVHPIYGCSENILAVFSNVFDGLISDGLHECAHKIGNLYVFDMDIVLHQLLAILRQ